MKRAMTTAESEWVGQAVELGCMICLMPAQWHHLRGGSAGVVGGAMKSPHTRGIPLCRTHHDELHAGVETWERTHGRQTEMHAYLVQMVGRPPEAPAPSNRKWRTSKIMPRPA